VQEEVGQAEEEVPQEGQEAQRHACHVGAAIVAGLYPELRR
jgi:hypothetical protein